MGNILSFRRRDACNLSSVVDLVDFERKQYAVRKHRKAALLCLFMLASSGAQSLRLVPASPLCFLWPFAFSAAG